MAGVVDVCFAAPTAVVAFVSRLLPRNVVDVTGVNAIDELRGGKKGERKSLV